jgi:serine O-acetyltransferase
MNTIRRTIALIAWAAYQLTDNQAAIVADVERWSEIENRTGSFKDNFLNLVAQRLEFRSLLHYRLYHGNFIGKLLCHVLFLFLKPESHLYLWSDDIGHGLYIQHGFGSGLYAKHVGKNVWINQEVTVGASPTGNDAADIPVIEDGATIYAGAKIVGPVRIGRNAIIGANAVVTKDVPDDMVAVGVPAVIRPKGRVSRSTAENESIGGAAAPPEPAV